MKTRHVYYSVTADNPFLPDWYIKQLEDELDPKMALRMIHGKWVEISGEVIYHNYSRNRNYKDEPYRVDSKEDIHWTFDFNIADGKPMSSTLYQYIDKKFHFYDEIIVHGARTEDICDDAAARGLIDTQQHIHIHGDQTGKRRDTRSKKSDYDIIEKFLANYTYMQDGDEKKLNFSMEVPRSNPPIRERHNKFNAMCGNAKGVVRLFVYNTCKILDEGCRLTKLKKGGSYIEDDSKAYQHVTTAAGYGIWYNLKNEDRGRSSTHQL